MHYLIHVTANNLCNSSFLFSHKSHEKELITCQFKVNILIISISLQQISSFVIVSN